MNLLQNDCADHQRKQQMSSCQKPISLPSLTEVKPPTLNSSFLQCCSFSPDYENRQLNLGMQSQVSPITNKEQLENKFVEEVDIKRMKKSQFSQFHKARQLQLQTYEPQDVKEEGINKKLVQKFITNLMKQAYVFKEDFFNSFQKMILTEKYLEKENNDSSYNLRSTLFYFIQDTFFSIIVVSLLIWQPLQVGFQIENHSTFNGIIITSISIDLLISYSKLTIPLVKVKQTFTEQFSFIDVIYLITCSILLLSKINSSFVIFVLIIQFLCGVVKLSRKLNQWQDYHSVDLGLYLFIMKILLILHYCACIWHLIAVSESESWITLLQLNEHDNYTRYCYSIYWSTASLLNIGQGTITITTEKELLFSSFIMFLSCWIFSCILFYTFNILRESQERESIIRKQLKIANSFFTNKKIPFLMRSRVRNHIKKYYQSQSDSSEILKIISLLQPNLKEDLLTSMRTKALQNCQILKRFSPHTINRVTQLMETIHYESNEIIQYTDSALYIIETGKVEVLEYNKVVLTLKIGDSFGECNFFLGNENQKTQFKTVEPTQLYRIQQGEFVKLIQQHKLDYEKFMFMKHSLENENYTILNLQCYSCNSTKHLISNCPLISYRPNIYRMLKDANSGSQERANFVRDKDINRRQNNQIFLRLTINYDSLRVFRLKFEIPIVDSSDDDSSDEDFSNSDQEQVSEQVLSNNKIVDQKDGTTLSILRSQEQAPENLRLMTDSQEKSEEVLILRQPQQQGTINTAQFQHDQQYRFSLMPIEPPKTKKNSLTQLEQMSSQYIPSEGPIPSLKKMKQTPPVVDKQKHVSYKKISNFLATEKMKRNLSKIKEEDSDTLNLSNRQSDDQLSTPLIKQVKLSSHSNPTKNTILTQSMKRIPSKLSTIQIQTQTNTNPKSNQNPFAKSNLQFFSMQPQLVDLSMYNSQIEKEEFESLYQYTIYFPLGNFSFVIRRVNSYLKNKFQYPNYAFKVRVREITRQLLNRSPLDK